MCYDLSGFPSFKGNGRRFLTVKPFANAEKTHNNTLSYLTEMGLSLILKCTTLFGLT